MFDRLVERLGRRARVDEPMSRHTTFRIGGPADLFVEVENVDELGEVVREAAAGEVALTVIGRGANVLVADDGLRGIVVHLVGDFREITFAGDARSVEVGAGTSLGRLVAETVKRGLNTFCWAAGVPGTIGGAVLTNAGSWGCSMEEIVREMSVMTRSGETQVLSADQLRFTYRRCVLPVEGAIVCTVTFRLEQPETDQTKAETLKAEYLAQKLRTQPVKFASAGCVFKNPPEDVAAELIERVGCKGLRQGGAVVSELHANYIVNDADARAGDVLKLIDMVRERVKEQSGVDLELELEIL